MRGNVGCLDEVERRGGIADIARDDAVDGLAMAAHDLGEGGIAPGDAERRELRVVQTGKVEAHRASTVSAFTTAASNFRAWSGRRICRIANIWASVSFWSSPITANDVSTE